MILKGNYRRNLQYFLAYKRAQWELEWENSPLYQGERERAQQEGRSIDIEPFGREQIVRSIPPEYDSRRLRREGGYLVVDISDAFVRETQRKVASIKRDIVEFDHEDWKRK